MNSALLISQLFWWSYTVIINNSCFYNQQQLIAASVTTSWNCLFCNNFYLYLMGKCSTELIHTTENLQTAPISLPNQLISKLGWNSTWVNIEECAANKLKVSQLTLCYNRCRNWKLTYAINKKLNQHDLKTRFFKTSKQIVNKFLFLKKVIKHQPYATIQK